MIAIINSSRINTSVLSMGPTLMQPCIVINICILVVLVAVAIGNKISFVYVSALSSGLIVILKFNLALMFCSYVTWIVCPPMLSIDKCAICCRDIFTNQAEQSGRLGRCIREDSFSFLITKQLKFLTTYLHSNLEKCR